MHRGGFEALDPCVHCGFCLPACPTYLATGDESDSPRGRILLMRALERGELTADDPAVREHLDACLGCRGCEPVCPAGVGYGRGLEAAREVLVRTNGLSESARIVLGVFRRGLWWRPLLGLARILRNTGIPRAFTGDGRLGFAMGMLAASRPTVPRKGRRFRRPVREADRPAARGTVALFRGCVMNALFAHVHDATRRTLEANGWHVTEIAEQGCCGALHDHAGMRKTASVMVGENAKAFLGRADYIVVNSAGCGAILKDAPHFDDSAAGQELAARTRDISELLVEAGPRVGAPLPIDIAYDAPCHLEHAQKVLTAPQKMLAAIPELRVRRLPGSDRCCGSAGIFSLLNPEMARAVLVDKIQTIVEATPSPAFVVTGNPGCLMQIGAGLATVRSRIGVAHPVELLDWSYAKAGYYR